MTTRSVSAQGSRNPLSLLGQPLNRFEELQQTGLPECLQNLVPCNFEDFSEDDLIHSHAHESRSDFLTGVCVHEWAGETLEYGRRASGRANGDWRVKGCDMRATCASGSSKPVTIAAQRLQDPSFKNWSHREKASVMTTTSKFCAAVVAARTSSCWIPVAPVPTHPVTHVWALGAAPQPCVQFGPRAEDTKEIHFEGSNVDLPSQHLVQNRQYRDTVTCLPAHTEQDFAKVADVVAVS